MFLIIAPPSVGVLSLELLDDDASDFSLAGEMLLGWVYVCLLLLFYSVESLARERVSGFDAIFYATPLRTGSILFGKALANSLVGLVIVMAAFVGAAIALLVKARAPLEIGPFALVWGLLLLPTFLIWCSFTNAVYAFCRDRYVTYAVALGAMAEIARVKRFIVMLLM